MAEEEKLTYVGYREGINPRLLSLGSLLFDFANPRTRDPYIHEQLSADDRIAWATEDSVENCWAGYSRKKGCSFGGGVMNLAELTASRDSDSYNVVVAKSGCKIELLKPSKFFDEVVLTSDVARFWLASRLTVSRKLKYYYGMTLQHPKLWMLTGLYVMKDATCLSVTSKNSGHGASGTLPIPEPTGIVAALQLNPNAKWDAKDGLTVGGGGTYPGDRIWAAQFHRVQAKYCDLRDGTQLSLKQLKLLDVFDMRASRGEASAADIQVEDAVACDAKAEDDGEYGEDYWEKFAKELQDIQDEFE
ncbi:MAG: hypothetical protein Q9191_007447 [Dirinaria sp. TL-2023a]